MSSPICVLSLTLSASNRGPTPGSTCPARWCNAPGNSLRYFRTDQLPLVGSPVETVFAQEVANDASICSPRERHFREFLDGKSGSKGGPEGGSAGT